METCTIINDFYVEYINKKMANVKAEIDDFI